MRNHHKVSTSKIMKRSVAVTKYFQHHRCKTGRLTVHLEFCAGLAGITRDVVGDLADPFVVRVELRVPQKPTDRMRGITIIEVMPHKTVALVTSVTLEVILVMCKQRRVLGPMKERDNIRILNPRPTHISNQEPKW